MKSVSVRKRDVMYCKWFSADTLYVTLAMSVCEYVLVVLVSSCWMMDYLSRGLNILYPTFLLMLMESVMSLKQGSCVQV